MSAPGAYYGAKSAGLAAESILGQERANAPIFARKPVYPGAPYPEAPVSAPEAALTPTQQATALGKVPIKTVRQSIALAPNATPQVQAQALGQLRTATSDIVDQVLPPTGETKGANLRTKSQVEFYLKKGDLDTAQQVLETAAPEWKGRYNPAASKIEFPKAGREIVEDQAILDALRADLESHGYAAHSTMVKEQIARQSVDTQKWMRVAEARGVPQGMEPARPYPHFDEPLTDVDLTKVLEESLKQTKERLGSKQYRMTEADARQKFVAQNKK